MDVQQQSRLGKSARRSFPEGEIAELASHDIASMVVGQFDVEAALRRQVVRQLTDKLDATTSN